MRIGTWNLEGRTSPRHLEVLETQNCDVWLLTEVPNAFKMTSGTTALSEPMDGRKRWAGIWSRVGLEQHVSADTHASIAAIDGMLVCSCVLPWRGGRQRWPGDDRSLASATTAALGLLSGDLDREFHDVVWGGDWNHALQGREWVGSYAGRSAIEGLATK